MTNFFAQVDEVRTRWDVLRHPFYERWSRGELAPDELAFYAGHDRHAEEERSHVALWDGFLDFVGGSVDAVPTPETAACAAVWADARRDPAATLATLYAIEAAQPAISETKRAGLIEHYGATPGSDATRYFDVHAVLDRVHAAHDRDALVGVMNPGDDGRLLAEIEQVLKANWQLLDGVQANASLAV
jgi:pyrroloquinoline-quinone synthase